MNYVLVFRPEVREELDEVFIAFPSFMDVKMQVMTLTCCIYCSLKSTQYLPMVMRSLNIKA
jgi:hypothetical protein